MRRWLRRLDRLSRHPHSVCPCGLAALPLAAPSLHFSRGRTVGSTTKARETSIFLYRPIEDVERFEYYEPGGYHPVKVGDVLHNRYRVVHKLGHGSYSTTWMARDGQSNRLVAVKIYIADLSPPVREPGILSLLSRRSHTQLGPGCLPDGSTILCPLLDHFRVYGPNGCHSCLVTSLGRMSLTAAKTSSNFKPFQLEVARAIAAQLAIVVAFIHSRGIVHGDLHLGNILLQAPTDLDQLSDTELYERYEEPFAQPVIHKDGEPLPPGMPTHGIPPVWLGEDSNRLTLPEAKVLLADFGEAFRPSREQRHESHAPLLVRPPEARFEPETPLSFPSDVWTLACAIWELFGRSVFDEWSFTPDDVARNQVDALGVPPPEWWARWDPAARAGWFDDDGRPIFVDDAGRLADEVYPWERRVESWVQEYRRENDVEPLVAGERDAFSSLLRVMLSWRPGDRPSAREVLASEWMVGWALPEYYKIRES